MLSEEFQKPQVMVADTDCRAEAQRAAPVIQPKLASAKLLGWYSQPTQPV